MEQRFASAMDDAAVKADGASIRWIVDQIEATGRPTLAAPLAVARAIRVLSGGIE